MADFKWLENLPPQRKEEELKKHINQLRREIKSREEEINDAEELLSRAQEDVRVLESIELPKSKPISSEFVELRTSPKEKEPLEEMLDEAAVEERHRVEELAQMPMQQIYQSIRDIYNEQAEQKTIYGKQENDDKLYLLQRAMDRKKEAIDKGEYNLTEKAEHLMSVSEQIVKSMYKN
jgi:hypothetical protein